MVGLSVTKLHLFRDEN
ncbi:TPA: DUF4024 domain-containing protein, partial [Streptococcus pneumoniae]